VRVAWLDQNPERVLVLLELLKDDESTMVRRSVANNLNDLGKVRPDLLIRTAGAWLEDASPERMWPCTSSTLAEWLRRRCSSWDVSRWDRANGLT